MPRMTGSHQRMPRMTVSHQISKCCVPLLELGIAEIDVDKRTRILRCVKSFLLDEVDHVQNMFRLMEDIIATNEELIASKGDKIKDLEFDVLAAKNANHLKGLYKHFERRLQTGKWGRGIRLDHLLKMKRVEMWKYFLEQDRDLVTKLQAFSSARTLEDHAKEMTIISKLLCDHVHDDQYWASRPLVKGMGGSWSVRMNPLTLGQASLLGCVGEVLGYDIEFL